MSLLYCLISKGGFSWGERGLGRGSSSNNTPSGGGGGGSSSSSSIYTPLRTGGWGRRGRAEAAEAPALREGEVRGLGCSKQQTVGRKGRDVIAKQEEGGWGGGSSSSSSSISIYTPLRTGTWGRRGRAEAAAKAEVAAPAVSRLCACGNGGTPPLQ